MEDDTTLPTAATAGFLSPQCPLMGWSGRAPDRCPWCIVSKSSLHSAISTATEPVHDHPTRRLQLRAASPYDRGCPSQFPGRASTIAVEADEIVAFANRFDPQTLHTDPEPCMMLRIRISRIKRGAFGRLATRRFSPKLSVPIRLTPALSPHRAG